MLSLSYRHFVRTLIVAVPLLAACSVTPVASGVGGSEGDPGTAVKQQSLAGTINGHSFAAASAIAQSDGQGGQSITIYSTAATCTTLPALPPLQILLDVTSWKGGTAYELDLAHSVTFVDQTSGSPDNLILDTGRVEVTAPASGATTWTLALRATSSSFGNVEGKIPVTVCGS
jgi:hypothetical protein